MHAYHCTSVSALLISPYSGEETVANLIALKYQKEWIASNEQRRKLAGDKKKVKTVLHACIYYTTQHMHTLATCTQTHIYMQSQFCMAVCTENGHSLF